MKFIKNIEDRIGRLNLLLLIYVLINLLQAIFTPLHDDETYYWIYSNELAWGYFDHPPAVAVLIKIGRLFFENELGVRLLTVLMSSVTALLIWYLIPKSVREIENSDLFFFGILVVIPGFEMYSFITTPDVPLIFSSVLYFHALKRIDKEKTLTNVVFWSIAAALLLYSKYHGGIVILLSIILRPKLLKSWTTYVTGTLAFVLIIPHLLWQYNHDFITFDYHLFQRTAGGFDPSYPLDYLGGTFGILNPALVILLILLTVKFRKTISEYNRFYLRMFWGFVLFFFMYSFRGRIEAQWVIVAFIPLVILLHELVVKNQKYVKVTKNIIIVSISLLVLVRFALVFSTDLQKIASLIDDTFYKQIEKVTPDDANVVFFNSFQNASKYEYYTGKKAFSYNSVYYRKNQYDLNDYDKYFNNHKVLFRGWWNDGKLDTMRLEKGRLLRYAIIDKYIVFTKVKATIDSLPKVLNVGEDYKVEIELSNPYDYDIVFNQGRFPLTLKLFFMDGNEKKYFTNIDSKLETLKANSTYKEIVSFRIPKNILVNDYTCQVVVNYIYPQYISRKVKVRVEE